LRKRAGARKLTGFNVLARGGLVLRGAERGATEAKGTKAGLIRFLSSPKKRVRGGSNSSLRYRDMDMEKEKGGGGEKGRHPKFKKN